MHPFCFRVHRLHNQVYSLTPRRSEVAAGGPRHEQQRVKTACFTAESNQGKPNIVLLLARISHGGLNRFSRHVVRKAV